MAETAIRYSDIKTVALWPELEEISPELREAIRKAFAESLDSQFLVMCGAPAPAPTTHKPFARGRGIVNWDGIT